jgi:hypothetical protein
VGWASSALAAAGAVAYNVKRKSLGQKPSTSAGISCTSLNVNTGAYVPLPSCSQDCGLRKSWCAHDWSAMCGDAPSNLGTSIEIGGIMEISKSSLNIGALPLTHRSGAFAHEYGWYSSESGSCGIGSNIGSDVCACQASAPMCSVSSAVGVYGEVWGEGGPEELAYEPDEGDLKNASGWA